jgi:GNAT superfamily N-acetyltransferase
MIQPRVLQWTDESIPELLELTRATRGTGDAVTKTEEFWRWKHCDNPFGRSYGIYARDDEASRAAALRILLRWVFKSPTGGELRAVRAVDTATHPDFQRRGLFSRLTLEAIAELRAEGTDLIFNTPNEKSWPGYRKMGWSLVDSRKIYLRPLRPDRMLRRHVGLADIAQNADPGMYFRKGSTMPWHTFVSVFGDQARRLLEQWEERRAPSGWRTARSQAYYEWRYGQHPNVTYHVYVQFADENSRQALTGLAVLRANIRRGWQEVVLCELALAKADVEAGRTLLRCLSRNLRADYIVAHFAPGTVEYGSIRRSGYVPIPRQGMRFTVRPLSATAEGVDRPEAWDLSLGDLEVF